MTDYRIKGASPTFRVPAAPGSPGGIIDIFLSTCGGFNVPDPANGQMYMIWTSDASEPTLTADGTATLIEFNAAAGMWELWIGAGNTVVLVGTTGGPPRIFAARINNDYQYNCG